MFSYVLTCSFKLHSHRIVHFVIIEKEQECKSRTASINLWKDYIYFLKL